MSRAIWLAEYTPDPPRLYALPPLLPATATEPATTVESICIPAVLALRLRAPPAETLVLSR